MGTPERSKIVGVAALSKFEDSPTFNFIDDLSPIQPVKSAHGVQVFHSLSFASISSVFTSPQVSSQKESRFRYPCSGSSKLGSSAENLDQNNLYTGTSDYINLAVAREKCNTICSLNEANVDPPEQCTTRPNDVPQAAIQYDRDSPKHNTVAGCGVKTEVKLDNGEALVELAHVAHDGVEKRKVLFATEIELRDEHQSTQDEEEVAACDWENLISVDTNDLLVFDSSTDSEACKDQEEDFGDDDATLMSSLKPVDSVDPYFRNAVQYPQEGNDEHAIEEHGTDHTPQILSGTFQNQVLLSDEDHETEKETGNCISADCKVESQQQRGMRRRCLTFELAGGSKKNSTINSNLHPSVLLPSSRKCTADNKNLISLKPGSSSLSRALPSIGLHLNTLRTIPTDRMVTKGTPALGKRFISMSCSINPYPPVTVEQSAVEKSLDVVMDKHPTGKEVLNHDVSHDDASKAPEFDDSNNLTQRSPKKRKCKSESDGDGDACKRCNCKKSKCLKLYCECFAAGIYCVEPCACIGCLNKPIHEETVLATRKQIESRNPLAFAPKVIRASKPVQDMGEETNKTPASARHKRGCNCKKSNCLKKYCECFQGGVGCSPSCRCEGCRNTFGRKDGFDDAEHAKELTVSGEKQQSNLQEDQNDHQSPGGTLPITPSSEIFRPFVKPSLHSNGKPPRSSTLSIGYSTLQPLRKCEFPLQKTANHFNPPAEGDTPEILRDDASCNNGVKTISPNGKRVSPPHKALGLSSKSKGGRKLILKSIPSFPSLNGDETSEH
ncbi:protein tesmin/TSO1-like CXC 2 [Asparagus officinalis]|uniref:protein tesmin/TSO1-like CXC 2 n=1 Tax=Asparagus officinalis TaxID=4686 RepID=UPI00098E8040|nr:protein tesmin/TSO1-like CXC 2 [Asparagus officinalis]